jgi:hypothetical protein
MNRESININTEAKVMQEKALLVFDLISRTLYSSLIPKKQQKDG